jgi:hypothetical protein
MSIINSIPPQYLSGFEELANLSDEEFKKIQQGLEKVRPVSSIDGLVAKLYQTEDFKADLADIFSSIGSLVPYIESKQTIGEIANDIADLSIDEEILKEEGQRESYINRLVVLLTGKQVFYASKADDLINNYGNTFILSRIVTDIRPVFDIELTEEIRAGMIIHNLTIHYQSNDEPYHKNITLSLTPDDVQELRRVLDRAELKEERLQAIFKKSEIDDLNE